MTQILVPFDFSKTAQSALDQALLLAAKANKRVEVLHITNNAVCRTYPSSWHCTNKTIDKLEQRVASVIAKRTKALHLAVGNHVSVHVKEAALVHGGIIGRVLQTSARLVVMGTNGNTALSNKVFGSNTAVMVNHALFPVLTIPPHWKPVVIEQGIAAVKLSQLKRNAKTLALWARFFKCRIEAVQFSILPEAEPEYATQTRIGGIPCRMITKSIETPLAANLLQFTAPLKKTMLLLFTREKTFLEKLLLPHLTYKLSGAISVPLLSLPVHDYSRA